jgi:prolipoprotein diacylglyceryl transferase
VILASFPTPPAEWQTFNIGEILRNAGASWATFDLTIHAYALCILTGIIVALFITNRRLVARGVEPWLVLDVMLLAIPLGIVGGRAYHVLTHPNDYFAGQDVMTVFYVWQGGMAIFGALILGAAGAYIGSRLVGLRFATLLDAVVPGLLIAQAFGRFGNWFNNELFGVPTDLPWGLPIDSTNPAYPIGLAPGTLFHPVFIYEAMWNVLGAIVIVAIARRAHLQWGRQFGLYLMWYGAGRVAIETIRLDPSETVFGIRVNVWASLAAIVLGFAIWYIQGKRHTGAEPSAYVEGRGWNDPKTVDSKNTYTKAELVDGDGSSPKRRAATSTSRKR